MYVNASACRESDDSIPYPIAYIIIYFSYIEATIYIYIYIYIYICKLLHVCVCFKSNYVIKERI